MARMPRVSRLIPASTAPVAPRARRGGHQFSPLRVGGRSSGREVDFVGAESVESFKHQAEGLLRLFGNVDFQNGHGAARHHHVRAEGRH